MSDQERSDCASERSNVPGAVLLLLHIRNHTQTARCSPSATTANGQTKPDNPKHTRWHKILNSDYSQRQGRAEWFSERRA